jgi:NADH:ubiquinone oxidoreductase subunit 4 (subunit M)
MDMLLNETILNPMRAIIPIFSGAGRGHAACKKLVYKGMV